MKKIYFLILIIGSFLFSVTSCEIDNYPEPNAQVYGAIRDISDGSLVETDLNSGSQIGAYELGKFSANSLRKGWVIKQNGEYRNNLVYANEYKFEFTSCNFFPFTDTLTVKPGENKIDFTVTPFIRVKNCQIVLNTNTNQIVATFSLEAGDASVKVTSINLYSWTDIYVGQYVNKQLSVKTGSFQNFPGGAVIDPSKVYQLTIDLASNQQTTKDGFGVHRDYYFRVGAMANSSKPNIGTIRANYAPYIMIPL